MEFERVGVKWINRAAQALFAGLLHLALLVAACDLLQMQIPPLAAGAALLCASALLPKRMRRIAFCVILAGLGIFLLAEFSEILDGWKLLANRLFAQSQGRQAYEYQAFRVSADPKDYASCMARGLLFLSMFSAMSITAAISKHRALCGLCALFLFAFVVSYLGVAPSVYAAVLLLAAVGVLVVKNGWIPAALCVLLLAVTTLGVGVFFPGESQRVSRWDEQLRDALAGQTLYYAQEREVPSPAAQMPIPETRNEPAPQADAEEAESKLPLILLLVALAVVLFVPSILADVHRKCVHRGRIGLDSEDSRAAVCAMFRYALRWLEAGGMQAGNRLLTDFAPQLEKDISRSYAKHFLAVLPIFQEAAYSAHSISPHSSEEMQRFLQETQALIWNKATRKEKLVIRYKYALTNGE
ncbi:MAG: hypothetical protein LBM28_02050 [Oscillospiraceae bacterium]|jgi:hypothetical protein|nr:hypothetical protein [Oscillospiraceae bacterium]